ncbi:hypothetical protein B0H14DRAFT_3444512 [Mycena olivaceomarginata]|nr:hypothetical protein B0H14DRAFT_3444512 [Mycena olivaceomarginata]
MTTAGAWQPPVPASAPTPPPSVAPFAPGYTYSHLAHLRLPSFENAATGKTTAPHGFEVMMSSTPPAHAPYPGPLRSWPTPPACAHCWDAIETHAMVTCRNEGWVESYATNIISLVSSSNGPSPFFIRSRAIGCHSAIAGEWKTQTVVAAHFDPFPDDHILPRREAENEDAILKKLGLHIVTANEQCQRHNDDLALPPNIPAPVVNVHYGIVFTGASCVVAQLGRYPPLHPNLVVGSADPVPPTIAGVFIARNRPNARSLIGLMLGMIWAHENVRVRRDLTGTQGRVDRMYDRYLTMYDSLVVKYGLKRRDGDPGPGMPYPPPGGPPEVRLVRLVEGMADITILAHPPEASPPVVAEVESNIPPLVRGIILFNIGSKCFPRHVLLWAGYRGVHLDGAFEPRADLAVRVDLSLLLASPTVPDGPLDLKIIKSVPIVGCLLTFPNARIDHIGDFKTPAT